jgi:predicted SAM-dependent methyltransferase
MGRVKQFIKRIPVLHGLAIRLQKIVKYRREKKRLKKLALVKPLRVVVGASGFYETGWIDTDIEHLNLLNPKHWEGYFQRNSLDAILAEHVWEHLTLAEGFAAAKHCFEFLKPGGHLRVAVPDGYCPDEAYLDGVRPGGTGAGAADHKVLYNHIMFSDVFLRAGFRVELLEYYDATGQFHFREWNPRDGKIRRSIRYDERNRNGRLTYTSLILDACKDA